MRIADSHVGNHALARDPLENWAALACPLASLPAPAFRVSIDPIVPLVTTICGDGNAGISCLLAGSLLDTHGAEWSDWTRRSNR
jgi:hypothetical protein